MEINGTTMRGSLLILSQHTKVLTPSLGHTDYSANTEKLSRLLWFFLMQSKSNTFKPQSQLHFSHFWWDKSWRQVLKWSLEEVGKTFPSHPTYLDNILLRDTTKWASSLKSWKLTENNLQEQMDKGHFQAAESECESWEWTHGVLHTLKRELSSVGNSESETEMLWYISGVQGEPRKVICDKN